MKITVLSSPAIHDAVDAWRYSRDPEGEYDPLAIAKVDAPVMEMPSAILAFSEATIFEREIFCSLRNHVVWARTSRVDDPFTFASSLVAPAPIIAHMRLRQAAGLPQDQYRLLLPLAAHTAWTQRITLRDLAKLVWYFSHLSDNCASLTMKGHLLIISATIYHALIKMVGKEMADAICASMKRTHYLNEGPMQHGAPYYAMGDFQVFNLTCSVALRAQIVRHREIMFVDDFYNVITGPGALYATLSDPVNMSLMATRATWRAVLGKRTCWIAQQDLWKPLLDLVPEQMLPCDDGKCPYEADAWARLTPGNDPNPPCPKFVSLYNVKDVHPGLARAMTGEAKKRGGIWA